MNSKAITKQIFLPLDNDYLEPLGLLSLQARSLSQVEITAVPISSFSAVTVTDKSNNTNETVFIFLLL